ncbi:hypothetical protein AALB16_00735 [Lachnospiraceae bacterium 62-35]
MRKKVGKWFGAIVIFCLLLRAGTGKIEAGDGHITKIELHFADEVKEGELSWPKEVYGPENAVYEVADVEEINMEEEDYRPGSYIRFQVTLSPAKDGRYFYEDRDNRNFTLTADHSKVTLLNSEVDEYGDLVVRVRYGPVLYKLKTPENVKFSDTNSRVVTWDEVEEASGYVVELMDGNQVVKTVNTGRTASCTLGTDWPMDNRKYYARVKAVPVGIAQKRYLYESSYGITQTAIDGTGLETEGEWVKYDDGWRYRLPDNRYYRGGWLLLGESWYYFDQETGLMQTGWICSSMGKWYYLDESGKWIPEKS